MIESKKEGEIKVRIYGYLYVKQENLDELSAALTGAVFRPMAKDGKVHNVLVGVYEVDDGTPIFADENENHESRDSETRGKRLEELWEAER